MVLKWWLVSLKKEAIGDLSEIHGLWSNKRVDTQF